MALRASNTQGYLVGKKYPGHTSAVKSVKADGNLRIVTLNDGTKIRSTKKTLTENLHTVMSRYQRASAEQGMRTSPSGQTKVTIGGPQKGERKTYANPAAAKAALTRHYGKS